MKIILPLILLIFTSCLENKGEVVWNIPSLIGKNIDEISEILGPPVETHCNRNICFTHIYKEEFKHLKIGINPYTLHVDFNPYTRIVTEFSIFSTTEYSSKEEMLKLGNLQSSTPWYLARCKPNDDGEYSYISIIPKKIKQKK